MGKFHIPSPSFARGKDLRLVLLSSIREEMSRMGNNPEGRGETSDPRRAIQRELFKTIIETQEKKARTASDPKDRESAQRLAEVAKKNLRDLK